MSDVRGLNTPPVVLLQRSSSRSPFPGSASTITQSVLGCVSSRSRYRRLHPSRPLRSSGVDNDASAFELGGYVPPWLSARLRVPLYACSVVRSHVAAPVDGA